MSAREHDYLPCPSFVIHRTENERVRWYCEQGNKGHWGTCCGGKSKATYDAQVARAREEMARERQASNPAA